MGFGKRLAELSQEVRRRLDTRPVVLVQNEQTGPRRHVPKATLARMASPDLAVLGQDPRFRGGALALMEAFWNGATALGHEPTFFYAEHPTLRGATLDSPLDVPGLPP